MRYRFLDKIEWFVPNHHAEDHDPRGVSPIEHLQLDLASSITTFPPGVVTKRDNQPGRAHSESSNHIPDVGCSGCSPHCPILPTTDTMLDQYWQDRNPLVTESLISAEAKRKQVLNILATRRKK